MRRADSKMGKKERKNGIEWMDGWTETSSRRAMIVCSCVASIVVYWAHSSENRKLTLTKQRRNKLNDFLIR